VHDDVIIIAAEYDSKITHNYTQVSCSSLAGMAWCTAYGE